MVPIHEDYATYIPPAWVRPTVLRLLSSLSEPLLQGLASIVLTDSPTAVGRGGLGRRQRKNRRRILLGRYHPGWDGHKPWIEIVVDTSVDDLPWRVSRFQFAQDLFIARVLFHEIGHHLHGTIGSAERGGEPSAEAWRRRLSALYFKKRFWYLRPAAPFLLRLVNVIRRRNLPRHDPR